MRPRSPLVVRELHWLGFGVPAGPACYGGGGDLRPSLREDVSARLSIPTRCSQRVVAGSRDAVRRMSLPHRLCTPLPQPPGLVRHAGGRAQPGCGIEKPRPSSLFTPPTPLGPLALNACAARWPWCAPIEPDARFSY